MQIFRFLLSGALNTLAGLLIIYGAMFLFDIDYRIANGIGYGIGCVLAFFLNKIWVFEYKGSHWTSAARWLVVVLASYALNLLVVIILHERLGIETAAAQLGGVMVYTASSFLGGRLFAFRSSKTTLSQGST